jgi:glycosyltransferase involved in cell wall biosynthesis
VPGGYEAIISVCMATYNGSRFISAQILSILDHLGESDELAVVDHSLTDNTVEIVESLHDHRIRVFRNARNLGVG